MNAKNFRIRNLAWIPAFLFALQLAAARADNSPIRKELNRLLVKGAAALEKGSEVEFIKSITMPEYTISMTTGQTFTKEQVLAQLKKQKSIAKRPSVRTILNNFKLQGEQAITEVTTTYSVTVVDTAGEMGALNKKHLLQKIADSRITWVKTSSGWKMKHSLRSPDRRYVDGKRIPRPRFDD